MDNKMMEKQNNLNNLLIAVFFTGLLTVSSTATARSIGSDVLKEVQSGTAPEKTINKPDNAPTNKSNKKSARPPRTRFGKLRTMIA